MGPDTLNDCILFIKGTRPFDHVVDKGAFKVLTIGKS